jgi:hypothetical protein
MRRSALQWLLDGLTRLRVERMGALKVQRKPTAMPARLTFVAGAI